MSTCTLTHHRADGLRVLTEIVRDRLSNVSSGSRPLQGRLCSAQCEMDDQIMAIPRNCFLRPEAFAFFSPAANVATLELSPAPRLSLVILFRKFYGAEELMWKSISISFTANFGRFRCRCCQSWIILRLPSPLHKSETTSKKCENYKITGKKYVFDNLPRLLRSPNLTHKACITEEKVNVFETLNPLPSRLSVITWPVSDNPRYDIGRSGQSFTIKISRFQMGSPASAAPIYPYNINFVKCNVYVAMQNNYFSVLLFEPGVISRGEGTILWRPVN